MNNGTLLVEANIETASGTGNAPGNVIILFKI